MTETRHNPHDTVEDIDNVSNPRRAKAEAAYEQFVNGDDDAFDDGDLESFLTPIGKRVASQKFPQQPWEQDDAVQAALIIIVRQKRRERGGIWKRGGGANLETWFKQVVKNACGSILRKKRPLQRKLNLSEDATQEEILQTLREQFWWLGSDESLLQKLKCFRQTQVNKTLKNVELPVYDATRDLRKGALSAGDEEGALADSNPVANAMEEEEAGRVNAAIQQLDDNERQVITMHYFEHMKQTDIAKTLGRGNAWVTNVKKAALNKLGKLLGDVDPSAGNT